MAKELKMARLRFTIRRLMIAVALVAIGMAFVPAPYYLTQARYYGRVEAQALYVASNAEAGRFPAGDLSHDEGIRAAIHARKLARHVAMLKRRYYWAAFCPFLYVPSDPPPPE